MTQRAAEIVPDKERMHHVLCHSRGLKLHDLTLGEPNSKLNLILLCVCFLISTSWGHKRIIFSRFYATSHAKLHSNRRWKSLDLFKGRFGSYCNSINKKLLRNIQPLKFERIKRINAFHHILSNKDISKKYFFISSFFLLGFQK